MLVVILSGCSGRPPAHLPDRTELAALLSRGSGPNVAATADEVDDLRLRPRLMPLPAERAAAAVRAAITALPRWHVVGSGDGVVWATRTTRLFRFVDDVWLLFEPVGDSTRIHARSASRIGRSDLGQNRRNLAELWAALDTGGTRRSGAVP